MDNAAFHRRKRIYELAEKDGTKTIEWYVSSKIINEHFSAMNGHEQMHIGPIIAFCYASKIHIPNSIIKETALNG